MSVSVAAMSATELASWLVATGAYTTYADAVAALNIVVVDGVGATTTALTVTGGAGTAVGVIGETALEVAAEAQLAATGTGVYTAGVGLVGTSGGGVAATGLLGVELGVVSAAVAPLLGVSLGTAMYDSNPQLWTKISQKLLPFCYPDTTLIPTWAEIVNDAWQVSVLKSVVDALKELFEDEEIPTAFDPPAGGTANYQGQSVSYVNFVGMSLPGPDNTTDTITGLVTSGQEVYMYNCPQGTYIVAVPGTSEIYYTYNRSNGTSGTSHINCSRSDAPYVWTSTWANASGPPYTPTDGINAARIITYGVRVPTPSGEYQPGTSEWEGTTPQEIPVSRPGAVVGTDGQGGAVYQPTTPISIPYDVPNPETQPKPPEWPVEVPYTQPVPSPDPQVQPDPTVTDDPQTQVEPYIQPLPVPWITTITETDEQTETDPTLDPSQPRPPTEIITEPPIDLGPEPIGLSPWPDMPDTPSAFPLDGSAGLITVYNPTPAELYAFESWLWVTLSQASVETVWNNPFDGVIGLFELYCTPTINGRRNIHSGFLDSGVPADTVSRYTYIDCGTLGIPEYYGNYLDYSPYSKAHIYLPFIGIQELNVDDIVGHAVNVTYRIDEYNGSCIAMITVAKVTQVNGEDVEYSNTMYQFSGNCAVELPISGGNQSSILAGMMTANAYQQAANISAGAQLVGGIASTLGGLLSLNAGGIGSGISQIVGAGATQAYGQAQALSNMLSGKSIVQKSGQFGSSHGALGIKVPFITITRPKQIQVPNYEELYGFPAHKMVTIGACQGFLRCREVHVVSATASDEEKAIIEQMLKSGVYVTE